MRQFRSGQLYSIHDQNIDVYRFKIPHYLQVLMDLNNAISDFLSR
jgi:hypothetical protein